MESLEFYFKRVPKDKKKTIVVLLDELDAMVTKSQDIMYNFFNWTTYENAKLIVIAVANTMDLPEPVSYTHLYYHLYSSNDNR